MPNRLAVPPLSRPWLQPQRLHPQSKNHCHRRKWWRPRDRWYQHQGHFRGLPSGKLLPEPDEKERLNLDQNSVASATPTPAKSTPTAAVAPKASSAIAAAAMAPTSSKSLSSTPVATGPAAIPTKAAPLSPPEPANRNHITRMPVQRTRTRVSRRTSKWENPKIRIGLSGNDNLAHLGFRATVVEKSHFWTNSYHVLVGPYG